MGQSQAVELSRARHERSAEALPGKRNGWRPRRLQAAEGELRVEIAQVREAAEPFVSKLFPRGKRFLRTEPLKALVIGAFVRGLSMRDVEALCEEAGLGRISKSTAARLCRELRDRYHAFRGRDLSGTTSCLSLCWAVLDLVVGHANRVRFDDLDRQLLQRIASERTTVEKGEEVVAA